MTAKDGDKVTLEYEGKLEDGEVFDSSKHGDHSHPLEFVVGDGKVIKGFNDAVIGIKEGEEKEFILKPEEAYGDPRPELNQEVPREALPAEPEPKEGMMLLLTNPEGQKMPAKISKVEKDKVTIDLNHPLAGKTLIFNITLTKIGKEKDKSADDKSDK